MRGAVIKDGFVVNVIEVEHWADFPDVIDARDAGIGDRWDGTNFIRQSLANSAPFDNFQNDQDFPSVEQ